MEVGDEGKETKPGDGDDVADGSKLPPPDGSSIGYTLRRKRQYCHSNNSESRGFGGKGAGLVRPVAALKCCGIRGGGGEEEGGKMEYGGKAIIDEEVR